MLSHPSIHPPARPNHTNTKKHPTPTRTHPHTIITLTIYHLHLPLHSPPQKIRAIWMYLYKHHLDDYDYFVSGVRRDVFSPRSVVYVFVCVCVSGVRASWRLSYPLRLCCLFMYLCVCVCVF